MTTETLDTFVGTSLLLFTGAEVATADTVIEVISKVGVIAVLWYWLKDMKEQMKLLLKTFDTETDEQRKSFEKTLEDKRLEHLDYKNRIDKLLDSKTKEIESLHQNLYEVLKEKKE